MQIDYKKVFATIAHLCEEGLSQYNSDSKNWKYQRVMMNYKYYIEYLERYLRGNKVYTMDEVLRYFHKAYPCDGRNVSLYHFPHLEIDECMIYVFNKENEDKERSCCTNLKINVYKRSYACNRIGSIEGDKNVPSECPSH